MQGIWGFFTKKPLFRERLTFYFVELLTIPFNSINPVFISRMANNVIILLSQSAPFLLILLLMALPLPA